MESVCDSCHFILVVWIEGNWVVTTGRGHNFRLSYNLFRGMQIKLRKYTC